MQFSAIPRVQLFSDTRLSIFRLPAIFATFAKAIFPTFSPIIVRPRTHGPMAASYLYLVGRQPLTPVLMMAAASLLRCRPLAIKSRYRTQRRDKMLAIDLVDILYSISTTANSSRAAVGGSTATAHRSSIMHYPQWCKIPINNILFRYLGKILGLCHWWNASHTSRL